MRLLLILCTLQCCFLAAAFALPPGAISIDASETFEVETSAGTVTCASINNEFIPGRLLSDGTTFLSCLAENKALKAKNKKKPSLKLKDKIKKIRTQLKEGNSLCAGNSATPTPTPGTGNFDIYGNVTLSGKINFQIPLALAANVDQGALIYDSMCTGCHGPKLNQTFTNYRQKMKLEPMYFNEDDIPDALLANLTAYLNRFNLP